MPPSYFPLRWESTGDQWWYASPIDFAAANGHYDLVRELIHLDTNLLIKLTSLRRIRRLETVWDDEEQFNDVAECRALVAKKLLMECETKKGYNTLIRAGYGGWLLYTAASAGDVGFVNELLERDPLLVFGEGEYGVTDILYAASRSKNSQVFRILLNVSILRQCGISSGEDLEEEKSGNLSEFRQEMMNRAIHAAARGGNLEILKELLGDFSDVLAYRDAQGSTLLHTASGRGQVEVAKDLIESFDITTSTDYQGNTALHLAAYRGYLNVAEILMHAAPTLSLLTNKYGDSFLHLAVSGFRSSGFRRVDKQIELVKQFVSGKIVNIQDIINIRNNDGRTALHLAVIENIQSNLVELLMTVPSIDLNIRDADGMTPLDLLKQRPSTASSEILIKQLISAGGISNGHDNVTRSVIASHLRGQGIGTSPGTSFRIPDAEIFLYTGIENPSEGCYEATGLDYNTCLSEAIECGSPNSMNDRKSASVNNATRRLKSLLRWRTKKDKKFSSSELGEDVSSYSYDVSTTSLEDHPVPLRQKFSKVPSVSSNNRIFSSRRSLPSPSTRKKFTAGLTHGVIQAMPYLAGESPSSSLSGSSMESPVVLEKERSMEIGGPSGSKEGLKYEATTVNKKLMNQYFCVGLAAENSMSYGHENQNYKQAASMVA